jgi:hypothetical protein
VQNDGQEGYDIEAASDIGSTSEPCKGNRSESVHRRVECKSSLGGGGQGQDTRNRDTETKLKS